MKNTITKGSELLKLTAFQLSTQSVGNLPSSPKRAAMPDTRHFYTQPLQLVTASVFVKSGERLTHIYSV